MERGRATPRSTEAHRAGGASHAGARVRGMLPAMPRVRPCPLPAEALLARYADTGAYADCYQAEVLAPITQAQFIEAFYTGSVFRLERLLLRLLLSKPSTDAQARQLAAGAIGEFAAWRVEDRTADQLLLSDMAGRTRSWLMVEPSGASTTLYFGSAVVPVVERSSGRPGLGFMFRALLGFHKLYSRVLLGAARARLARAV